MTMIKLSDGCYVAADQIAEVEVNEYAQCITVRMKDGIGHSCQPGYGEGVYAYFNKLIAEINTATAASSDAL